MQSELSPFERAQNFERFRAIVVGDLGLVETLRPIATPEDLARAVVLLGAERGFVFTEGEVLAALQVARQTWMERDLG